MGVRKSGFVAAVLSLAFATCNAGFAQPAPALPFNPQYSDPLRLESEILKFEQDDRIDRPPEGAIVLTGSSSIRLWNDQAKVALAPLTIPRGFGTATCTTCFITWTAWQSCTSPAPS